jgi:hypothetical protein
VSYESEIREAFRKSEAVLERLDDDVSDVGELKVRVAELSNAIEESLIVLARGLKTL